MAKYAFLFASAAFVVGAVACATGSVARDVEPYSGDVDQDAGADVISAPTGPSFSVGGTVTGMKGTGLVLQNSGLDVLVVTGDGPFAFTKEVQTGSGFAVSVKTQPTNPSQTCTVANGSGAIADANVTNVTVTCVVNAFTIGGTVSGMLGSGLVLENNGADDLAIPADGKFTFATSQDDATAFAVTVKTDPSSPDQTCLVAGGKGTLAGGNVESVTVNCSDKAYTIGGTVTNLKGNGLVLTNNNGDDLNVTANGTFAFATPLKPLAAYKVAVKAQPTNTWQTCSVTSASGNVAHEPITTVSVNCVDNTYSVGGTVTGLVTGSVVLTNNGADALTVAANGTFTFDTWLASGSTYDVEIATQPADRDCVVSTNTGSMTNTGIIGVNVTCQHTGCRSVNGLVWCKDATPARSCNTFCSAIGLGNPTISDSAWFAAQDTQAECTSIASAFGMSTVSISNYPLACTEVRSADFACSTTSTCPTSHRTSSDTGSFWAVCPCGAARACATADEDTTATLTCPVGTVVQSIDYASFGLPTGTCGNFKNAACNATTSLSVVQAACLGKTSCTVPANVATFGNPCSGQNKLLYIQASCQ